MKPPFKVVTTVRPEPTKLKPGDKIITRDNTTYIIGQGGNWIKEKKDAK
jgi:hypothetical protein